MIYLSILWFVEHTVSKLLDDIENEDESIKEVTLTDAGGKAYDNEATISTLKDAKMSLLINGEVHTLNSSLGG